MATNTKPNALADDRSFKSKTVWATAISVAARGVGFLVPFFIAAWFGATWQTDVLFFAYAVALFISNVMAPVLETLTVPFIAQIRARDEDPSAFVTFLSVVAPIVAGISAVALVTIFLALLPYITGFDEQAVALTSRLLVAVTPLVALTALSSVFAGALNSSERFYITAASPFVRAVVNLTVIWALMDTAGVAAVIYGYVAGEAARSLLLLAACARGDLVSRWKPSSAVGDVGKFFRVAGFQVLGMLSIGFVPLIDRTMASWLSPGSVSLLEYADRVYQIPIVLLGSGLVVTSLTRWSDIRYRVGLEAMRVDVTRIVWRFTKLALAASVVFMLATPVIVRLAYSSLQGDDEMRVTVTLLAFLLGATPFVVGQLYNRALLALKQTRFLFGVTLLANLLNIALNLALMRAFGIVGLALSSAMTALVVVFVLRYRFDRVAGDASDPELSTVPVELS